MIETSMTINGFIIEVISNPCIGWIWGFGLGFFVRSIIARAEYNSAMKRHALDRMIWESVLKQNKEFCERKIMREAEKPTTFFLNQLQKELDFALLRIDQLKKEGGQESTITVYEGIIKNTLRLFDKIS